MSWHDVESVMAFWYREGAARAWGDVAELKHELETLDSLEHLFVTSDERAIHLDMRRDLLDQWAYAGDELRAQLRLVAADRQASISMRM